MLEWDAKTYAALPLPHERWGAAVLAELDLAGHETVVDLGCGTGRDTARLLERLPRGRVIAVDGSPQMLAELRERVPADYRLRVVQADLREPIHLEEPVDAVMSVATLHWLDRHEVVFASVAHLLRPGGTFVADAGGAGNLERVLGVAAEVFGSDGHRYTNFVGVDETRTRLAEAGFTDVDVRLVPDPVPLPAGPVLEAFLATIVLAPQLRELPEAERAAALRAVAERIPEGTIDYVRLRLRGRRR